MEPIQIESKQTLSREDATADSGTEIEIEIEIEIELHW
jgi:hypothetical protein